MKLFKWLLVSTVVTSGAYANFGGVYGDQSGYIDPDFGRFAVVNSRAKLIKDAAIASDAAYNDSDLVAVKSNPIRNQWSFPYREEMERQGHQVISFSAISDEHGHVPAGIVTYKEENGIARITVSYHGSESVQDFKEANLRAFKQKNAELGIDGYIHGGFNTRYMQSRESLHDVIDMVISANGKSINDVEFLVTGHSLGGALAHLAAIDIKKNLANASKVDLVTFCSPRVVDAKGAAQMEELLDKRIVRIWRENDIVPTLSPGTRWGFDLGYFTGFKHAGESVKLKKKARFGSLINHVLGPIIADAISEDDVEIDLNHVGYYAWMGNIVSKVVWSPVTVPQYAAHTAISCASQVAKAPAAIGGYVKSWFGW